jgi:hypothetical protein
MHELLDVLDSFTLSLDAVSLLAGAGVGGAVTAIYSFLDRTGTVQAIKKAQDPESPGGEAITRKEAIEIVLRPEFLRGLVTLLQKGRS